MHPNQATKEIHNENILVPVHFMEAFGVEVAKMNKKCKRMNLPLIVTNMGEIESYTFRDHKDKKHSCAVRKVEIAYPIIKIDGSWTVRATVEATETPFNLVNGRIDNIDELKHMPMTRCDHCGTKRQRNKIIVIENDQGERKFVGSTCIKDFMGIDPKHVLHCVDIEAWINRLCADLNNFDDEEGGYAGLSIPSRQDLKELVAFTYAIVKRSNWTYRSPKNYENNTVNAVHCAMGMCRNYNHISKSDQKEIDEIMMDCRDPEIDTFLEKITAEYPVSRLNTEQNSFDYTLGLCLMMGSVGSKQDRLVIGMLGYRIAKEHSENKTIQTHNPKNSNFVGSVGEKMCGVDVELTRTHQCDGFYGTSLMVCGYIAGTDNQFVAYLSGNTNWLFSDNKLISNAKVSFTVKKHQENPKYGKQTTLTRFRMA